MSSIVSRGSKHKVMGARDDFDLPKYELNKLTRVYLNAASRTPLMKKTYEMGQAAMARQMQTPWSIADEDDELSYRFEICLLPLLPIFFLKDGAFILTVCSSINSSITHCPSTVHGNAQRAVCSRRTRSRILLLNSWKSYVQFAIATLELG